jgi:hypothetical protein
VLLWLVVSVGTIKGALSGQLFYAPCLKDMENREKERVKDVERVV